jgi:two-component system chemotaxis response regulator CheB
MPVSNDGTGPLIVIGASAGGLPPLQQILRELPAELPVIICVVLHLPPWRGSSLARVLSVDGRAVVEPMNHQALQPGRVYVAPPDHHLMVEQGHALLWHGPKENAQRPSVNALFRSAAIAYRSRAIGVVLSGALEDGATGLWWIKKHGGVAVVQDPNDAQFASMPESALSTVEVDHCLPARAIPNLLIRLIDGTKAEDLHA